MQIGNLENTTTKRELALLRIKHNEARSALAMADNIVSRTKSELRILERLYWRNKNQ